MRPPIPDFSARTLLPVSGESKAQRNMASGSETGLPQPRGNRFWVYLIAEACAASATMRWLPSCWGVDSDGRSWPRLMLSPSTAG
jgi:hypothetical protein